MLLSFYNVDTNIYCNNMYFVEHFKNSENNEKENITRNPSFQDKHY